MTSLQIWLRIAIGCAAIGAFSSAGHGEDWPQWMGGHRDNVMSEALSIDGFDSETLEPVWKMDVAGGYAGPAVSQGRVFVSDYVTSADMTVANFERQAFSGIERVFCLDAANGKVLWKHEYPVNYSVSYPAGPRCTPTVDGDRVYSLGTEGNLFCFAVDSGEIVWSKDLPRDFGTKTALWGYASHPLVDGDKLICVVGGEGSHMVAFDKLTGEVVWRQGTSREQGYVPPTIIEAAGVRQLIAGRPDAIASLDPETGKEYWSVPYEASNGSIIMSPITIETDGAQYLFMGGYDKKNVMMKLTADKPGVEVLWQDENRLGLSPVNVQPIVIDQVVYGFNADGRLLAFKVPGGERLWETSQPLSDRPLGSSTAFIVRLGQTDRVLMFTELGDIVLGSLSPEGFEEIDRAHVIEPTGVAFGRRVVWSAPAYSDGRMYVRNDKELRCIKLD